MWTKLRSHHLLRITALSFLTGALLLSSCVEQGTGNRGKSSSKTGTSLTAGTSGKGTGSTAIDTTATSDSTALQSVKVELSHLVDPFDGTYKKKVSIPKNYKGNLYLAGLNISALSNKLVKVRFTYGLDRQSVVLDATVARAPGIIPQTDIQVLVIDMNSKPFSKMRLGYDLYDYNDYDSDPTKVPVTDNRDSGLYCRGLQLSDDPTFDSALGSSCSGLNDKCLYAYAKVTDSTLYNLSTGFTTIPTRPQIWSTVNSVRTPSITTSLSSMCLPDTEQVASLNALFNVSTSTAYNTNILGMLYRGPYRAIDGVGWRIQGNAIFNASKKGLFELAHSPGNDAYTGFRSLLFPRAGRVALNQNVSYLGSSDFFARTDYRSVLSSDSTGTSNYVNGCNLRVMNYDATSGEGIGSCNVNAKVEVFYMKDDAEVSIATDNSIKLQLLRASLTDYQGKEVLATAFKRCESSSTCGTDECCFNSRCWSKDLVTQCVDQTPIIGNQPVGYNCASDYECSTLCCNQATGACAPHDPSGTTPILCSKTAGQRCVSKEFCKPENVATCKIIKGPVVDSKATCTLRCTPVSTYGECTGGYCVPPVAPAVPAFDPSDCSQAVDP